MPARTPSSKRGASPQSVSRVRATSPGKSNLSMSPRKLQQPSSAASSPTNNNKYNNNSNSRSANLDDTLNSTTTSVTTAKANPFSTSGIVVAVRIRPFNKREMREPVAQNLTPQSVAQIVAGSKQGVALQSDNSVPEPIVDVESDGKTVSVLEPAKNYAVKVGFHFDHCFSPFVAIDFDATSNSMRSARGFMNVNGTGVDEAAAAANDSESAEREQNQIFQLLGLPVVDNALNGFNSCLFSYGQTAAGKTYTMMGTKTEPGVIPRVCRALFKKIEAERIQLKAQILQQESGELEGSSPKTASRKEVKVQVTYLEIYNERVRDLLRPRDKIGVDKKARWNVGTVEEEFLSLKVRQHPIYGAFVDGLTKLDVNSWIDCVKLIRQGNELRMAAATDMNDTSSRSHAIFQLMVTQTEVFGAKVRGKDIVNHRTSKINLVDLAGSERQGRTQVTGKHLNEANYINTSLSTLRKVIDVLNVKKKGGVNADKIVVPYRESLLTWLLSDNFGGNSKTAMIANVSPHWSCLGETESTLRYATLAKGIVNRVRLNEDPSAKLIRDLQNQLRHLQDELKNRELNSSSSVPTTPSFGGGLTMTKELEEQMEMNKKAMDELEAKESGMMELIKEARQREEVLRMEKEGLERDQLRWKREAERLAREKMELMALLEKHNLEYEGRGIQTPSGNNKGIASTNFWQDSSAVDVNDTSRLELLRNNTGSSSKARGDSRGSKVQASSSPTNQSPTTTDADANTTETPQIKDESFACPPQPRKYARRRTSVLDPKDLVLPGHTGLEDSVSNSSRRDTLVRNNSKDDNDNDEKNRPSSATGSTHSSSKRTSKSKKEKKDKKHKQSRRDDRSADAGGGEIHHQNDDDGCETDGQSLPYNPLRDGPRQHPNSRGSNAVHDSHQHHDDQPTSAMLLGSLIQQQSTGSSAVSTLKPGETVVVATTTSRQSSQRSHRGKDKKEKKEKKDKKDKKSRKNSEADLMLADPFAHFGPKTESPLVKNDTSNNEKQKPSSSQSQSSTSQNQQQQKLPTGVSRESSSNKIVSSSYLTETSIPPLLSSEKDNNNNNKSSTSANTTPQHGRRSANSSAANQHRPPLPPPPTKTPQSRQLSVTSGDRPPLSGRRSVPTSASGSSRNNTNNNTNLLSPTPTTNNNNNNNNKTGGNGDASFYLSVNPEEEKPAKTQQSTTTNSTTTTKPKSPTTTANEVDGGVKQALKLARENARAQREELQLKAEMEQSSKKKNNKTVSSGSASNSKKNTPNMSTTTTPPGSATGNNNNNVIMSGRRRNV